MPSYPVIKGFSVIKGSTSGLGPCLERLQVNALAFETMKEALRQRSIIAVGSPAHTDEHTLLLKRREIALTGRGTPTI